MFRDLFFSSASEAESEESESDSETGQVPAQEPQMQQGVEINQNIKRLGISLAGMTVLLVWLLYTAVQRSTIPRKMGLIYTFE